MSISGLHMVLAAGTVFWLTRALLALAPTAALLWPVKKIAAVVAMAGAGAYCVFSGSEVATERSLVMTLVMLGAVLVDRPALSIRNLTLAALVVLAREPESLIGPSFQMSFGAVAALTALAPLLHPAIREGAPRSPAERAVRAVGRSAVGLVLMTLVASFATAPFSAFHFQTLNPFGLLGNALALPLVSLAVMPAAVLGILAYPFGLDAFVWQLMGVAVARVLDVSALVSGFSGSTLVVPALGRLAFGLMIAALLVATVPASALRWLAVLPAGAGLALAAAPLRYDALVDRAGAGAAIRGPEGRLVLVGRPSGFVVEQWLRADGDARSADDPTLRKGARCDRLGCVVTREDGRSVAYVQDIAAFEEDCRRAAIVVTRLAAPGCRAGVVLDRDALKERGAVALRFDGDAVILRSTAPARREERLPLGGAGEAPKNDRPRPARPTIDLPDAEDLSSDEPG